MLQLWRICRLGLVLHPFLIEWCLSKPSAWSASLYRSALDKRNWKLSSHCTISLSPSEALSVGRAKSERCSHRLAPLERWKGRWLQILLYAGLVQLEWHSIEGGTRDVSPWVCYEPPGLLEILHLFCQKKVVHLLSHIRDMGFIIQRSTDFPLKAPVQMDFPSSASYGTFLPFKNWKPLDPLNRHLLTILTAASAAPVTGSDAGDDVGGHGRIGQGGSLIRKGSSSTGIFGLILVFNDDIAVILRRLDVSVFIVPLLLICFFLGDVYLEGFTWSGFWLVSCTCRGKNWTEVVYL